MWKKNEKNTFLNKKKSGRARFSGTGGDDHQFFLYVALYCNISTENFDNTFGIYPAKPDFTTPTRKETISIFRNRLFMST
jgi:hypothetical protein